MKSFGLQTNSLASNKLNSVINWKRKEASDISL